MKHLLSPLNVGPYTLKNRIIMAPLTRMRAGKNLAPTTLNAEYYRQRATAGLIISEASQVSEQGQGYPRTPGIYNDEQVEGWKKVTQAVHEEGGHIFLQLWHTGRISHSSHHRGNALPVSASAIPAKGFAMTADFESVPFETPHELEADEIEQIIADYRAAAENAQRAGFDGVEVHAANGYLIQQFLTPKINQRTDEYGGSIENNARLLFAVLHEVIQVWGADKVGIRLSPFGSSGDSYDPDAFPVFDYVIEKLNDYELAYLHVIRSRENETKDHPYIHLERSLWKKFKGTLILADNFTPEEAEKYVTENIGDAIAFGRAFIANPDLVQRIAENAPLNAGDRNTYYGGTEKGYTDYPLLSAIKEQQTLAI